MERNEMDVSGNVSSPALESSIRKIFDELNGRGVMKPVVSNPETLARLLTIGLTHLQERLVLAHKMEQAVVDTVLIEVANTLEYVIALSQKSGLIKLLKPSTGAKSKPTRRVLMGSIELEEEDE